jgi:hypothetical protein
VGRCLLLLLPVPLWFAAQHGLLEASGFVLLYALAAPFLYLFVPAEKRSTGAKLLIWVWAPAVVAGAMTAYTSATGYATASVGLAAAMILSGLFFAWALEAAVAPPAPAVDGLTGAGVPVAAADRISRIRPGSSRLPWLALLGLSAVIAVTVSFQFQFQQRSVPYRELTSRFDSGPWWGIKVTPERRRLLDAFAADLKAEARLGDQLFVFDEGSGYYLYWNGGIASNTYWNAVDPATGMLSRGTISYYRRHHVVPTLVVHLIPTAGLTDAELQASSAGLEYPPVLVRPAYAFQRRPATESTADVLARLPRP